MEVKIKSIHFDATLKLEEFIDKKMQKLARRNEAISLAEVTLKVVKPETAMNKEASVKLSVEFGRPVRFENRRLFRGGNRPRPRRA